VPKSTVPLFPWRSLEVSEEEEVDFYNRLIRRHFNLDNKWSPASRWADFGALFEAVSNKWTQENPKEPAYLSIKGPLSNGWCAEVIWARLSNEEILFTEVANNGPLAGCKAIALAENLLEERPDEP
jgi:hypothetical protein